MASVLSAPHFHNEEAAYAYVEARLWPKGPVCPFCGAAKEHVGALKGKTTRAGLYKCYACRKPFTVKIGTVMESSHVPVRIWLQAIHLLCSSKKGISTRQLQRTLGVGMKTAWFLGHRIREAMIADQSGPMGSGGGFVEMDETYFARDKSKPVRRSFHHLRKIVSLVERGGEARSFHVETVTRKEMLALARQHMGTDAHLRTDESAVYNGFAAHFASHESVHHKSDEYVRGDAHTNTVEGFFSVFKRGMVGVYQQCGEQHLQRYLTEFDFRYSNREKLGIDDAQRADLALKGVKGKRLTYQTARGQARPAS